MRLAAFSHLFFLFERIVSGVTPPAKRASGDVKAGVSSLVSTPRRLHFHLAPCRIWRRIRWFRAGFGRGGLTRRELSLRRELPLVPTRLHLPRALKRGHLVLVGKASS